MTLYRIYKDNKKRRNNKKTYKKLPYRLLQADYIFLSDATKKQRRKVRWGAVDLRELYWCADCTHVFEAGTIRLYDESSDGGDMILACPHCSAGTFFRWDEWLRSAIKDWTPTPDTTKRYYLRGRCG